MSETLRQACLRVHETFRSSRGINMDTADRERRRVWAAAIDRGVTYRELGDLVGMSHSNVYRLLEGHVQRERAVTGVLDQPL